MNHHRCRQKIIRFLLPGWLGSGFLLGVALMLWLAATRKPIFDECVLFVIDFLKLINL